MFLSSAQNCHLGASYLKPDRLRQDSSGLEGSNSGNGSNPHDCDVYVSAGNTGLTVIEDGTETSWTVGVGAAGTIDRTFSQTFTLA